MRVGFGYDAHGFDSERPLVLGGVTIEGSPGLSGWSDADVICHAIADALLGGACLGDLGSHFTEDSVAQGFSGLEMLRETAKMVDAAGYRLVNIDCVVVIQEVRVAPHRERMTGLVAEALGADQAQVSIKATTTDRLGFTGRGEGAAGMAVVLIEPVEGGRP
ncbi:MAG: 2-C-methyl-D-erythritol 2,4-cyclodiphosphate synthase [Actinomycetota bacterium]|nr:2-C-methyl-D-erythritol 2,4-cyclodiphosphate synthase [Actinomycetota bacterium]